ncbi:MAG: hypothetical protein K8T20_06960 [Planctomycetes bacterium]|nr:hypothetical protein [Planctomycetota bacterium]
MSAASEEFLAFTAEKKRAVHLALCEQALDRWNRYIAGNPVLEYRESVCGTLQKVDTALPYDALTAAKTGSDPGDVGNRYAEPIAAMQDDDLEFPDDVEFAYYSIYNLFGKYVEGAPVDDWLIVNQALSSEAAEDAWLPTLEDAVRVARQLPD